MCGEAGLPGAWPWVLEVDVSGGATFGELLEGGCCGGGGGVDAVFEGGVALRSFVHISATHFSQGRADYRIKTLLRLGVYKMKVNENITKSKSAFRITISFSSPYV